MRFWSEFILAAKTDAVHTRHPHEARIGSMTEDQVDSYTAQAQGK
jgi:hypothetical protein